MSKSSANNQQRKRGRICRSIFAGMAVMLSLVMGLHPNMSFAQTERIAFCYGVTDGLGNQNGADTLVSLNVLTGETNIIGGTNTVNVEAIAFSPDGTILYAADAGILGTLALDSGAFTQIGTFGEGDGDVGVIEMTDVDSLTYDITTDTLFGTHRRPNAPTDLLFKIDPATGAIIADGFGAGNDYVEIAVTAAGDDDVDDIAADPFTGVLYAVVNSGGAGGTLITIDKVSGAITEVGPLGSDDIEGLGFLSDGSTATLYGSTGDNGPTLDANNKLFEIDKSSGASTLVNPFPETETLRDYESLDCTIPAGLGDYVWEDIDQNGVQDAGEPPVENVTVNLWTDNDGDGTPDTQIRQTTTNADGFYEFLDLTPTQPYIVQFIAPTDREFTQQAAGGDNSLDSNADPESGITDVVTLAPGEFNPTIDAGILPQLGSIGDTITCAETGVGIPNVTVTLTDDASGLETQVVTDANGNYIFDGLSAGDYTVTINTSTLPDTCNVPTGDPDGVNDNSTSVTLGEGEDNLEQNFEYSEPEPLLGSIGDTIICSDTGTGIANVTITLVNTSSNETTTTVTDATGNYIFNGLPAGEYTVTVDTSTLPNTCNVLTIDPDGNDDNTSLINLSEGENNLTQDFTYAPADVEPLASLGDYVWEDTNENGLQDAGEPPVEGITVNLWTDDDADGNPDTQIDTTTTDADGAYSFTDLDPSADYIVQFVVPAGREFTSQEAGDEAADSNPDPATGITGVIEVDAGENDSTIDAGLLPETASTPTPETPTPETPTPETPTPETPTPETPTPETPTPETPTPETPTPETPTPETPTPETPTPVVTTTPSTDRSLSLGNQVWLDANNNGLLDVSESGVADVTLVLWTDDNGNGLPDTNTGITTVTDAAGNYIFTDLEPGDYVIQIPLTNFAPGAALEGLESSTGNGDATDPDDDGNDDDDGMLVNGVGIINTAVTLALNDEPTNDGDSDANTNLSVDFGFFNPDGVPTPTPTPDTSNLTKLGDRVFLDANQDGIQGLSEEGVPGVTVLLEQLDANGTYQPLAQTVSDEMGAYTFSNLEAGEYIVKFVLPVGYNASPPNQGADDGGDSDGVMNADGIEAVTEPILLETGDSNTSIDQGIYQAAELGDRVFVDSNQDGVQDAGETGLPGVVVVLYQVNEDGSINQAGQDTTDSNGNYLFEDLVPGDYQLLFQVPKGYLVSPVDAGDDDAADSDGVPSTDGTEALTSPTTLDANESDPTLDLGVFLSNPDLVDIGDLVFRDENANGIQDPNEAGISNVTVILERVNADGTTEPVEQKQTGPSGEYLFSGLEASDYQITFITPNSYAPSPADQGGDDASDSDGVPNSNGSQSITSIITLETSEMNRMVDQGYYPLSNIGSRVWYDENQDGLQSLGESGVPGVTVILEQEDPTDGTISEVARVATNSNGDYLFANQQPGVYTVKFVVPTGYTVSPQNVGGDITIDSDGALNGVEALTSPITLAPGNTDLTYDLGLYLSTGTLPAAMGDRVWYDNNQDGIQDADEPGIQGILVELFDENGNEIAEAITNEAGEYTFGNLAPAAYSVRFVSQLGYLSSPQGVGDDTTDSDADPATGLTAPVMLVAGQTVLDLDAGFYAEVQPPASISNLIWYDDNADGVQDEIIGRAGIPGVIVNLFTENGVLFQSRVTGTSGEYEFNNIPPGSYYLEVELPAGYSFSPQDADSNDTIDSDIAPETGRTVVTTLDPGENDSSWDAGAFISVGGEALVPSGVGSRIWDDENRNGIQDQGESTVPGVAVRLYASDGTLIATTVSDASGFLFGNIPPGDYYLEFDIPNSFAFSNPNEGGNPLTDSNADPATGRTAITTLEPGEINLNIDAGIFQTPGGLDNVNKEPGIFTNFLFLPLVQDQ